MGSSLKIQNLHLLNVQVYEFPPIPTFSMFNFISISRTRRFPQFRTSIKTSLPFNKLHSLSLSSSSSPAPVSLSENSSNEHSFEVSYLINTFGWSPELASSKAKYLKFNTSEKPDKVLDFLKKHGFTKTQISSMVERCPWLIHCNRQKTLLPKLRFLSSIGLSSTEISSVITAAPYMLQRNLEKIVVPSYNVLRTLVGSDDKAVEMIKRNSWILTRDPEVENIQILQEVGVPIANILVQQCRGGCTTPTDTFRMMVERVKEMGFDPSHMKFLLAIRTMRSVGESTWERRVQLLKKYGWSDREVFLAFENNPKFIMFSDNKIVALMDFLVNRMGVEAATIANGSEIFNYSMEKRIVPRCLVYQVLLEKGFFDGKRKLNIRGLLAISENKFLSRIENEAPELFNFYQEMLLESK